MSAQAKPTYGYMTSVPNQTIKNHLITKYGLNNTIWPIVLIKDDNINAYIYEKSSFNDINSEDDRRPSSNSGKSSYFIDYTSNPRKIIPSNPMFNNFIDPKFSCSYEYMIDSPDYSTVDIDYVWNNNKRWIGIETTTFYMEFHSKTRAEELIGYMHRRQSWQGPAGPHGMEKIVQACNDLNVELYLVCVNVISKGSTIFKEDGNVYWFKLTNDQIKRLFDGKKPIDGKFDNFQNFLSWM